MAGQQDTADVVMQQVQMVCFAIPGVGPGLAACVSIADALYDAFGKVTVRQDYSVMQAISDVGTEVITGVQAMFDAQSFAAVKGFATSASTIDDATTDYANTGTVEAAKNIVTLLETDFKVDTLVAGLSPDPVNAGSTTARNVQLLPEYLAARNSYHAYVIAGLSYAARAAGVPPTGTAPHLDHPDWPPEILQDWSAIRSSARSYLVTSLTNALDYATPIVDHLVDVSTNLVAKANAAPSVVAAAPGQARNAAFTAEIRRLRAEAHLDIVTAAQIATHQQTVAVLQDTLTRLDNLAAATFDPTHWTATDPADPQPGGVPVNAPAPPLPASKPLGPRSAKSARFLYESKPGGGWVNVVGDSSVTSGPLVAQNAGSTSSQWYYQVGGGGLNQAFHDAFATAGLLQGVNSDLADAYDAKFPGRFAADSANPPSPPPLTSFMIGLDQTAPVGQNVVAMMYSVGPQLATATITDVAGYEQIFADAYQAMADWGAKYPPITAFRVALLSTALYGAGGGATLAAQAAGLIIDATVAALKAHPVLAGLVVLVNTKDTATACGPERVAFNMAAAARGVTPGLEGFDIIWT